MKIKMKDILGYSNFYNFAKTQKLPAKIAHKLTKLSREIEVESTYYQNQVRHIVTEYAELDENGNFIYVNNNQDIKLKPGTDIECHSRINELQNLEIEFTDFNITIEEIESMELTIEELNGIFPFIQ